MIEISLKYHELIDKKFFLNHYTLLIERLQNENLFSERISKVIFTDDFENVVNQLIEGNENKHHKINREREYFPVSKIIDLDTQVILVFDINFYLTEIINSKNGFLGLITQVKVEEEFNNIKILDFAIYENSSFDCIVENLFWHWAINVISNKKIENIGFKIESLNNSEIFIDTFKKNIKKLHFEFQEKQDLIKFQTNVILSIDELIRRLIDIKFEGKSFDKLNEFELIIPNVIDEVIFQCSKISDNALDLNNLKEHIIQILHECFLKVEVKTPFQLRITDDPIKLFLKSLLDTDQRIVAYIDILGFKEHIKEYDSNPYSNKLKELYKALNESIETSINEILKNDNNSDIREVLDYKMFSDCICISLPYHDSYISFQKQFHYISIIVKTYQYNMMRSGFFLRGGISIGSYYSDNNMIFSGGLVSAYKIETQINYPIIGVDKKVIERFQENYSQFKSYNLPWDIDLVSTVDEKIIFINPFDLLDGFHKNIDFITNALDREILDSLKDGDSELNSLLSFTKNLTAPIFKMAKNQINKDSIEDEKRQILERVKAQIVKQYNEYQKNSKWDKFKFKIFKKKKTYSYKSFSILKKYLFLSDFIEWSLGQNKKFKIYKIKVNE